MKFYMPTKLYSENNCVANHADEFARLGTNALIVTGKSSSKKNGSLDDVTKALKKHNIRYTVFDETEENPSVETVMKARGIGLSCGADLVIGIGGGSPLDAAKAIALMIKNPEKNWEYLYEKTASSALPVAAVPTTCGTGSEVTGVAVLTRHDLQTKVSMTHRIFPAAAFSDGKYILDAPRDIIVNTSVDALSHLIESCISSLADDYSDITAFAGLRMWNGCRGVITGEAEMTASSAQLLMNTSTLAGISIAQTGTTIPHALSYLLTCRGGIPHGAAVGLFQANFLELAEENRRNAVLNAAGFSDTEELRCLIRSLVPVKPDRQLTEQSAQMVMKNTAKLASAPFTVDDAAMKAIIDIV